MVLEILLPMLTTVFIPHLNLNTPPVLTLLSFPPVLFHDKPMSVYPPNPFCKGMVVTSFSDRAAPST